MQSRKALFTQSLYTVCLTCAAEHHETPSETAPTYVQLAFALMKYMGIESDEELAEYGVESKFELIDIFSKVN